LRLMTSINPVSTIRFCARSIVVLRLRPGATMSDEDIRINQDGPARSKTRHENARTPCASSAWAIRRPSALGGGKGILPAQLARC
jgi:hypothetical protein